MDQDSEASETSSSSKEELSERKSNLDSKWIHKNLHVIIVVFMFNFLAYNGLASLQVSKAYVDPGRSMQ